MYVLTLERFKSDWSQHGAVTPIYIFRSFCADVYSGWSACTVCIVLHFSNYGRRNTQSETERQEQLSNPSIAFRTQTPKKEKYENILSLCALNREQLESVTEWIYNAEYEVCVCVCMCLCKLYWILPLQYLNRFYVLYLALSNEPFRNIHECRGSCSAEHQVSMYSENMRHSCIPNWRFNAYYNTIFIKESLLFFYMPRTKHCHKVWRLNFWNCQMRNIFLGSNKFFHQNIHSFHSLLVSPFEFWNHSKQKKTLKKCIICNVFIYKLYMTICNDGYLLAYNTIYYCEYTFRDGSHTNWIARVC